MSNVTIRPGGPPNNGFGGPPTDEQLDRFVGQIDFHLCIKGQLLTPNGLTVGATLPVKKVPAPVASVAVQPAGLALNTTDAGGENVTVQYSGIVEMTTAEWDVVAGTSGGLNPTARYYADRVTSGNITSVAPTSGQIVVPVGVALSPTKLLLTTQSAPTILA